MPDTGDARRRWRTVTGTGRVAFEKFPKDEEEECFVWHGWMDAIAALALEELRPLVVQAFEREFISPSWTEPKYFDQDLAHAAANPDNPFGPGDGEMTLWGDTIEELSTWYAFSERYKEDHERARRHREEAELPWADSSGPYINAFRDVGRNDPCPCGSGKKFNKCCIDRIGSALGAANG